MLLVAWTPLLAVVVDFRRLGDLAGAIDGQKYIQLILPRHFVLYILP